MADEDDIDLKSLNDEDLVEQMHEDLYDGLADEIEEGVNILLGRFLAAASRETASHGATHHPVLA